MIHNNNNSEPALKTFSIWDLERECTLEMNSNGIHFEGALKTDGELHRFSSDQKKNQPDEWYICHEGTSPKGNPYLVCVYGTWSGGGQKYYYKSYEKSRILSMEELNAIKEGEKKRLQEAEEELENLAKEKVMQAQKAWGRALEQPTSEEHLLYLKNKMVDAHGVRFSKNKQGNNVLVVPIRNLDGLLHGVQYIESDGTKRIHGLKKGNFHVIGEINDHSHIYISEGYATGATVYKATREPVVVAFDCGNLDPVIANLRSKFSAHKITIVGDDDRFTTGNPGRTKAETAAKQYGCDVVFPKFDRDRKLPNGKDPTDFNDLHHLLGIESVKLQIQNLDKIATAKTDITDTGNWKEPEEFEEKLPPVPEFDPELLPEALRLYAQDAANRMQCPLDFIAAAQLVMFSSLIGAGCVICPKQFDNWMVVPNVWGGIVGPPSVLKTPALNEGTNPMGHLERIADEQYKEMMLANEINEIEKKIRKKNIETNLKAAIDDENTGRVESHKTALLALEKEGHGVQWKRYKTNDSTIEKLGAVEI